ncbi:MAG: KpsF/GutQ family sugar-phosphate isomerase [Phycisphaeraceae bacterium]|nr:KpsF/GutQ family sugar-phosphate isomerase [Phycisphaeraceae bacterium]
MGNEQVGDGMEALARKVLRAEADAVAGVPVDAAFGEAVDLIYRLTHDPARGALVVSGLGKSNFIGQKIVATFASTGTPSHFLHPTEAMHGDLGRIRRDDVVLLLSFSGHTEEVVSLAAILRQDGVPVIAMTGRRDSDLARLATVTLWIGDVTEACPHNLAPTASTTAMLALGDALALCVSRQGDFGVEDFRRFHPGGNLGRQLMPVVQAMRFKAGENLPLIPHAVTLRHAYDMADAAAAPGVRRAGAMLIVDDQGKLAGIFTDGDLRRLVIRHPRDAMDKPMNAIMTAQPRRLRHVALVRDAVAIFRELRIDEIPVVDDHDKPLGLIDVQDLVSLKVIEG